MSEKVPQGKNQNLPPSLQVQEAAINKALNSFQMKVKEYGDDISFQNMTYLTSIDQYECPEGSGIFYKRRMLKPAQVVKLGFLQNKSLGLTDPQKIMDNIRDQALICLLKVTKGKDEEEQLIPMTKEDWDETDAIYMEQITAACFLMTKSFRKISKPKPKETQPTGQAAPVV